MRTSFFTSLASVLAAVSAQSVPTNGTATVLPPAALPSATATSTFVFSAGPTPLICSGTVITAAPAGQTASPIAIDSNGILTCTNDVGARLTGFLREAAPGNPPLYDVVLGTPPPVLPVIQGYFTVTNGQLTASVSPRTMRRKRQSVPLNAGLGAAGTLQVGGNIAPGAITATQIGPVTGPSSAPVSSATAAPSNGNGVAPGVVPVTVTQTNTVTVTAASGAIQTLVVVQVTINGLPVGSVSVFVNINGVLVQVTVTGLSVSGNIVTIGAGFSVAPVVVSVIVIVSPVLYVSAGVTISGVTTVTGFVTAIGGGAGAVTVINSAAPVTITRTQTIVVPAGTVVPVAAGAAVVAVVVAPGSVPVIAAAAAARSNSSTVLPAARGTAAKFGVSGLVAGVVAVGVAALF